MFETLKLTQFENVMLLELFKYVESLSFQLHTAE